MNEIFKLFGTIAIEGVQDAEKEIKGLSDTAEKSHSKIGSVFKGIGTVGAKTAKVVGGAMIAAGGAVAGLVAKSTSSYAEYEQLVGGVDTLFKDSSAKVQKYAENAYKTAGMSANEYMNTVTSFSASLLQSLGGDTEKAADKADMAITDMSDNANKMGTSMESIQNAYQGFAKQNYTMLDNLKLGYGGTKEEMERLLADAEAISGIDYDISSYADVVDAIHVIQTEMGITGTTSKEAAGTISGSMASVKGAWANLMTAMASDNLPLDEYINKFVDSASAMVSNMLPRIQQALVGVVQLINELAPVIIGKIPELLSQLLPSVIEAATGIIDAIVAILPDLIQSILDMMPAFINGLTQIINAIIEALPSVIQTLVAALPTLIPMLIDGLVSVIVTLCNNLMPIIQPIIDALPTIIMSIVNALINNLPIVIEALISLTLGIVQAIPQIIQSLVDAIPTIVEMLVTALLENLPMLIMGCIQLVIGIVKALPQIFASLIQAIPNVFKGIWEAIKNVFAPVGEWFSNMWNSLGNVPGLSQLKTMIENVWGAIKNHISTVVNAIKNVVSAVWNAIKSNIGAVINAIKTVISSAWNTIKTIIQNVMKIISSVLKGDWEGVKNAISNIINAIKQYISTVWNAIKNVIQTVLNNIKNVVSTVWNSIKTVISSTVNTVKSVVSNVWNGIKSATSNAFNGIKTTASKAWNDIKSKITTPIENARDEIKGIVDKIKGFFSGMKLSFPKIKMPHFSISPSGWKIGDLLKGSIPKLGIDWYAKGGIIDSPRVIGVGEDGAEAVVPLERNTGWINKVADEVAEQINVNNSDSSLLNKLEELIRRIEALKIYLNGEVLVGELVGDIDIKLGQLTTLRGRGN